MKKNLMFALALGLLLVMSLTAAAQDVQLLQNDDMEDWSAGPGGPPDNWSVFMTDTISARQEASIVHGGTYSTNLTWISPTQANCDFLSDPVAVTEGSVYACTLWANDNDAAGRITISYRWNVNNYYPNIYTVDSPNWQTLAISQTAPAGATSLRVGIRCYDVSGWDGNATVFVDDVHLWGPEVQGNNPPAISNVLRFPFPNIYATDNVVVEATIQDIEGSVASDSLYSRVLPGAFSPVTHDSIASGDIYWFTIGYHNAGDSVEYFVAATDNEGARAQSPTRGYTVLGANPGQATIYSLQHTTNQGVLPDCFPTDSSGVHTITGKVVGRYENPTGIYHKRFFLQEAGSAWNGIYVYNSPDTVQLGDSLTLTGAVAEYFAETEFSSITTQVKHASGRPLPNPVVVTAAVFSYDSCSASAEPYEGMLIQINNVTVVGDAGNGDFWATDATNDSCIIMDDVYSGGGDPPTITIGQQYTFIKGIGRYTFGAYKIAPRFASDVLPVSLECTGGDIFYVEQSFDPGSDTADCWPSPDTGQIVTVCGIVTAVTQGTQPRFYLQDQSNTAWGGIHCYDFRLNNGDTIFTSIGDYVQISSRVHEYYGWTELDSVTNFIPLGSDQPLPDTTVITVSDLGAMCDYTTEPYENILVRLNGVTVVSDNGFGELWIRDNSGLDSIRIDSDLWTFGSDQPDPIPSVGASYDWIVGVVRWEGREGPSYDRGWIVLPRFASDYEQLIIPEPNVLEVWSVNSTRLAATFDRVMDPVTTENPANYATVHGLVITGASLDSTGRRVYLTTSTQPNNMVDSLVVVNVCDSSGICITTPQQVLYHSGITPISVVQTPEVGLQDTSAIYGHVVTVQGVIVCDTSMTYPNNLFINDTSGPPYNGVLIFLPSFTPYPLFRDTVIVTAKVSEYFGATELTDVSYYGNLSIPGTGGEPVPYQATASQLLADGEGFEGVLACLCDSFTITNDSLDAYGFLIRSLSSPNDSIVVHRQAVHTRYTYVPVEGTIIRGITGVYRFQRDKFRLSPRRDGDFNSLALWCGIGPGCAYIPGDINNNGDVNGVDVGYGVNYFKGFGPPPPVDCGTPVGPCPEASPYYAAGDVNANMTFNGVDITYFVNYLKGIGPPLGFAPDCPPAAMAGSSQPETPTILPRLKSKTSVVGGME